MTKVRLPPIGFLSYARSDDELSGKRISRLCRLIRSQLQLQLGRDVDIFQDTAKIPHGAVWEKRTREAISSATFFIPIVTPAYLGSAWCAKELRLFREREQQLCDAHPGLARTSCIFPIHLIEVDEGDADDEGIFEELRQLQFFEFRESLFADYDAPAVRAQVARFVTDIRDLLKIPLEQPEAAAPPVRAPSKRKAKKPASEQRATRKAGEGDLGSAPPPPQQLGEPAQPPVASAPGGLSARDRTRVGWTPIAIALVLAVVIVAIIVANQAQRGLPTNFASNMGEASENGAAVDSSTYDYPGNSSYGTDNAGNASAYGYPSGDTGGNSLDIETNTPGI